MYKFDYNYALLIPIKGTKWGKVWLDTARLTYHLIMARLRARREPLPLHVAHLIVHEIHKSHKESFPCHYISHICKKMKLKWITSIKYKLPPWQKAMRPRHLWLKLEFNIYYYINKQTTYTVSEPSLWAIKPLP